MASIESRTTTSVRCPACTGENPSNFRQCRFCRAWLFESARCALCSQVVSTAGRRCPGCGADFAVCSLSPVPVASEPRVARLRFWIRVSTAAAIVDIVAALALWIVSVTRHLDTSVLMLALLLILVVLCVGLSMRWYEPADVDVPLIPLDGGGGVG